MKKYLVKTLVAVALALLLLPLPSLTKVGQAAPTIVSTNGALTISPYNGMDVSKEWTVPGLMTEVRFTGNTESGWDYGYLYYWDGSKWVEVTRRTGYWDQWYSVPAGTTRIKVRYTTDSSVLVGPVDAPEVKAHVGPTVTARVSTNGALNIVHSSSYGWSNQSKEWMSPYPISKLHWKGQSNYRQYVYYFSNGYWYSLTSNSGSWDTWVNVPSGVTKIRVDFNDYYPNTWVDVPEVESVSIPVGQYTPQKPSLQSGASYWNTVVTWGSGVSVSDPSTWELWRKTLNSDGAVIEDRCIYSGSGTSYTTTDQGPRKYYLFRVRLAAQSYVSQFSPEASYWTPLRPSVQSIGPGTVTLSIPKVMNGLTYQIAYRVKGGSATSTMNTTSLTPTIAGLDPSQRYEFATYPVLSDGGTAWGDGWATATPLALQPGAPTFGAKGQTFLDVSWASNGNGDGTRYDVWWHPSSPFKADGTFSASSGTHAGNRSNPNSVGIYLGGGWNARTHYNECRITVAQEGGNKFLRFISDGSGAWAGSTAGWSIRTGKWYRVTAFARTNSASPISISDYAIHTGSFNPQLVWNNLKSSDGWKMAQVVFQADADRSGNTYLYGNVGAAGTTIDYDNIVVEEFDSNPGEAEPQELKQGIEVTVFNTANWYNSHGHPADHDSMMAFFDPAKVSLRGKLFVPNVDSGDPPFPDLPDTFSAEYRGKIYAPTAGAYYFATDSDDASEIEIDGKVVVGWYGPHGKSGNWSHNGQVYLEQGLHTFVYRMEEGGGGQDAHAAWKKPGDSAFSVIPVAAFGVNENGGWLTVTSTSATVAPLSPGTYYNVMVEANNADDVPGAFAAATCRTVPARPTVLRGNSGPLGWSNSAGRGWVTLNWDPVPGATGYKVWVFDGNIYRAFDVGNALSWDSRQAKIYPSESQLDQYANDSQSGNLFSHNKSGLDLRDDPNKIYLKTVGTGYNNRHNYWFRISAYNESGESPYSDGSAIYMPTLPNRTDTGKPTGSVLINGDQMLTASPSVILNLTYSDPSQGNYTSDASDDASGVSKMRISNDNQQWTTWLPIQETYNWTLSADGLGEKTVYVQFMDVAGNISDTYSDKISYYLVDTLAPTVNLKINGGALVTHSQTVTVEIDARDDLSAADMLKMSLSNDYQHWTPWENYQPYKEWTLPGGDGDKKIYVKVKDAANNAGIGYANISLQTQNNGSPWDNSTVFYSPTGAKGTVVVNGVSYNVNFVASSEVVLKLNAPGATTVRYSLDGMRWLAPESVSNEKVISLPDWDGLKTVYALLPNGSSYLCRFYLDKTAPKLEASWLGGATVTDNGGATLLLNAEDNASSQEALQVKIPGHYDNWRPFAQQLPLTFSGSGVKPVMVYVRDQAGNIASKTLTILN